MSRAALAALAGSAALLASVEVLVLALGLVRVPLTAPIAAGALAASVAAALALGWRLRGLPLESAAPSPDAGWLRRSVSLAIALAALGFAAWVFLALLDVAWARDPIGWDGLWYHLPAIHAWARRGGVGFVDALPDVPFVNTPMVVESTSFLVLRLLGTDRLVDAGNLWFWPLAVTAIAALAVRLGARGPWPWLAGGLVATCPAFLGLSATTYLDPGLASAVMAAIAAGAWFASPVQPRPWSVAVLFGLTLGLTLGAKVTGLPYAVVIGLVAGVWRAQGAGWSRWRTWVGPLAIAAGVALLVGGYWYLRNLAVTGNPLYPFQVALGSRVIVPGWDYSYFGELGVPDWMRAYPGWIRPVLAWWRGDAPSTEYMFSAAGLGRLWVLGGLPAVGWAWWLARRPGARSRRDLALLTVTAALLLAVSPIPWRSRLTIWLLALGLPALGVVLHHAADRRPLQPLAGLTLALGGLVIGLGVQDALGVLGEEEQRVPAASPRYRSALDLHFPGLRDEPGFAALLAEPRIARTRWATDYGTLLGGALALPVGRREIDVVPPGAGDYRDPYGDASVRRDPTEADLERLIASGVRWLVVDGDVPPVVARYAVEQHDYRHPGTGEAFHAVRLARPTSP